MFRGLINPEILSLVLRHKGKGLLQSINYLLEFLFEHVKTEITDIRRDACALNFRLK